MRNVPVLSRATAFNLTTQRAACFHVTRKDSYIGKLQVSYVYLSGQKLLLNFTDALPNRSLLIGRGDNPASPTFITPLRVTEAGNLRSPGTREIRFGVRNQCRAGAPRATITINKSRVATRTK